AIDVLPCCGKTARGRPDTTFTEPPGASRPGAAASLRHATTAAPRDRVVGSGAPAAPLDSGAPAGYRPCVSEPSRIEAAAFERLIAEQMGVGAAFRFEI